MEYGRALGRAEAFGEVADAFDAAARRMPVSETRSAVIESARHFRNMSPQAAGDVLGARTGRSGIHGHPEGSQAVIEPQETQ